MKVPTIALSLLTLTSCGQSVQKSRKLETTSYSDTTKKQQMVDYSPSPGKAHPTAKKLMTEDFYWSPIEETGPFGNDDGADTYAGFAEWRQTHKTDNPKVFLSEQIQNWGYPTFDLAETNFEKLKPYLQQSSIGTRFMSGIDAAIIAIAFGQLYLEGTVEKEFKGTAITAIKRQLIPQMLNLWADGYRPTRESQLKKMLIVLEQIK